jgi:hypothetical protein
MHDEGGVFPFSKLFAKLARTRKSTYEALPDMREARRNVRRMYAKSYKTFVRPGGTADSLFSGVGELRDNALESYRNVRGLVRSTADRSTAMVIAKCQRDLRRQLLAYTSLLGDMRR